MMDKATYVTGGTVFLICCIVPMVVFWAVQLFRLARAYVTDTTAAVPERVFWHEELATWDAWVWASFMYTTATLILSMCWVAAAPALILAVVTHAILRSARFVYRLKTRLDRIEAKS